MPSVLLSQHSFLQLSLPPTWPQCRPIEFGPTSADAASPAFPQPKPAQPITGRGCAQNIFPLSKPPNWRTNLFPFGLILSAHRNCSSLFPL
ncbi:hypothetical protein BBK36DRAFT_1134325, partial [Trichoderma citrinoviride]